MPIILLLIGFAVFTCGMALERDADLSQMIMPVGVMVLGVCMIAAGVVWSLLP